MSNPKRYDLRCRNCGLCDMEEWDDGEFVRWPDYEKLLAENARIIKLFAATERLMLLDGEYEAVKVGTFAHLKDLVERLSDDNKRLRFVGDMLADCLDGSVTCLDHNDVIARWKAEKGGMQS